MTLFLRKDTGIIPQVLTAILDHCVNGVTLADPDQEELQRLRESLKKHEAITVTLRNYRKDGTLFHNRLAVTPLRDNKGDLLYYLGVQYDITYKIDADSEIRKLTELLDT